MSRIRLKDYDRKRSSAEKDTARYSLREAVKCGACGKMGVHGYGMRGEPAIKHKVRSETVYCAVEKKA